MIKAKANVPEITVKLFAHFRESAGNVKEVIIPARTVGELVDELVCRFEGLKGQISKNAKDGDGQQLHPYVNIMVNGVNIADLNGIDTKLDTDCEVAIFPPVSGG